MNSPEPAQPLASAIEHLRSAKQATGAQAAEAAAQAITLLKSLVTAGSLSVQCLLASAWMVRGNALRDQGTSASRADALRAYDDAIALLKEFAGPDADLHLRDTLANAWTNRGIALLNESTAASLAEAIRCFDAAIAVRRELPLAENPWFRYGLTAGWMNRADALTRLGSPAQLQEAVRSYDEALVHLRQLPLHQSPLFKKRLVIACMNRGLTLQTQGTATSLREAIASFDAAIAAAPEDSILLAAVWMNRGNALLRLAPVEFAAQAREAANSALALLVTAEAENILAAEVSFKSRHILCQSIAQLLTPANADELVGEATDAVDAGMALARQWDLRGVTQFRELACALFRFGARVYQTHQPHFLVEFLVENLDPVQSPGAPAGLREMHTAAAEALWFSLRDLQRGGFKSVNTPRFEHHLTQLRDLKVAESRLAELRSQSLPG